MILTLIFLFICSSFILFLGVFCIRSNLFIKTFQDSGGKVLLTFDDGPHPINTPKILSILEQNHIQAVFFLIGNQCEKYPSLVKMIYNNGHSIGNHTWSHHIKTTFYSRKKYTIEIQKTQEIIFQITGKPPQLFRPPFGVLNPNIANSVTKSGLKIMAWNIRSFDTMLANRHNIFRRIQAKVKQKSIILLHEQVDETIEMLPDLIKYLKNEQLI